jgi:histidinol dehydrogenase
MPADAPLSPILHHRAERLVYPALSRRAGGLSIGINLFPEGKVCDFDCPYCEVPPARAPVANASGEVPGVPPAGRIDLDELRAALDSTLARAPGRFGVPVIDVSFSGDGEPTLSPDLVPALAIAAEVRDRLAPTASLVLITNAASLGDPELAKALRDAIDRFGLDVWAKLDADNEARYRVMNAGARSFDKVVLALRDFSRERPVTLQSMFCSVDGKGPSARDIEGLLSLAARLKESGSRFREYHIYTQARPAFSGRTAPLADQDLLVIGERAVEALPGLRVRVFGELSELLP